MVDYIFIKDKFNIKHKQIDDCEYLDKYINFLLNYKIITDGIYTENHHILPNSTFPEFKNDIWNIVKLTYNDHKLVHLWLFKSINIRKYQRPLNWMVKNYKNKGELSNAAKNGWVKLKKDKEKYKEFCKKRSIYMKSLSSDEQRRRANIFWRNITDDEYLLFCNKMKDYWTDNKKIEKSNNMKEFYSNPDTIVKKSKDSKQAWKNMSNDDRLKFREKMNIINKNEEKRRLSGNKIKELWKNEKYLEKMKNRKSKPGKIIKIINTNGDEIMVGNMKSVIEKYNFSAYLIRKHRDTKIKIFKKDLNNDNIVLLGSIIESVKK